MKDSLFYRLSTLLNNLFLQVVNFVARQLRAIRDNTPLVVNYVVNMPRTIVASMRMFHQANGFSLTRMAGVMLFLLVANVYAYAQGTDPGEFDGSSPEALIASINWAFTALTIVGGYLSAFIPGINKITSGTYRVAAFAIIAAVGFVTFGFGDMWQLLLSYAVSTSLYEVILKPGLPSRRDGPADTTVPGNAR